ncbi:MAG: hexapeptide transferase family protein [Holophagaceae bacterium]|nr:hexapeptide transferase family protein [Holophagaceae bacterium]
MRLLYWLYVLRALAFHKLLRYARHEGERTRHSAPALLWDAGMALLFHDVHPSDYFCLHFPDRPKSEVKTHANTLFMRRFHRRCNARHARGVFQDKLQFLETFSDFTKRSHVIISKDDRETFRQWLLRHRPAEIIVKTPFGTCGLGVMKLLLNYDPEPQLMPDQKAFDDFSSDLVAKGFGLAEECLVQHAELAMLNPSSVNTIRLVTILDSKCNPHILAAVLRVGVGKSVDNFHAGGIAILVDLETGMTKGSGFRMEPSDEEYFERHPLTQVRLTDCTIPYWREILLMVKEAAELVPGVGTVGWDVAVTPSGPCLIEGNDNWDKTIVEKALGRGIRQDLERFLSKAPTRNATVSPPPES